MKEYLRDNSNERISISDDEKTQTSSSRQIIHLGAWNSRAHFYSGSLALDTKKKARNIPVQLSIQSKNHREGNF